MRSFNTLVLCIFLCSSLFAQQDDVPIIFPHTIGGSFNFSGSTSSTMNSEQHSFNVAPYYLFQGSTNWQYGFCLSYGRIVSEFTRTITNSGAGQFFRGSEIDFGDGPIFFPTGTVFFTNATQNIRRIGTQFSACLLGRYTFNPGDRFQAFLQPALSFSRAKSTETVGNMSFASQNQTLRLHLRTGAAFLLSPRWRINALVGNFGWQQFSTREGSGSFSNHTTSFFGNLALDQIRLAIEYRL